MKLIHFGSFLGFLVSLLVLIYELHALVDVLAYDVLDVEPVLLVIVVEHSLLDEHEDLLELIALECQISLLDQKFKQKIVPLLNQFLVKKLVVLTPLELERARMHHTHVLVEISEVRIVILVF